MCHRSDLGRANELDPRKLLPGPTIQQVGWVFSMRIVRNIHVVSLGNIISTGWQINTVSLNGIGDNQTRNDIHNSSVLKISATQSSQLLNDSFEQSSDLNQNHLRTEFFKFALSICPSGQNTVSANQMQICWRNQGAYYRWVIRDQSPATNARFTPTRWRSPRQ
jgi:hypothetical protein